jgi:ABC-type phosphate/phosphonate transport system substrate-binding protein
MMRHPWLRRAVLTLGLGLTAGIVLNEGAGRGAFAQEPADPAVLHIGIVDSLVKDLTPARKDLLNDEFADMVREFAGYKSKTFQGGDPWTAARKLAKGEWHIAVLPGVEFAWAQTRDPKLQPVLMAINGTETVQAIVMAKKESPLSAFADLKGKKAHLVKGRIECQLYVDKAAQGAPEKFFGTMSIAKNEENALDDVLRGKVDAAVVDNTDLDFYKRLYPGRFAALKELARSETFPPTVIAYQQGTLGEATVKKLRAGMRKANGSDKGRDAMAHVRITAFEEVPANFAQRLSNIVKAYPPPPRKEK